MGPTIWKHSMIYRKEDYEAAQAKLAIISGLVPLEIKIAIVEIGAMLKDAENVALPKSVDEMGVEAIKNACMEVINVSPVAVCGKSHKAVRAKKICTVIARHMGLASYKEIAKAFHMWSHASIHAYMEPALRDEALALEAVQVIKCLVTQGHLYEPEFFLPSEWLAMPSTEAACNEVRDILSGRRVPSLEEDSPTRDELRRTFKGTISCYSNFLRQEAQEALQDG